MALPRGSSLDPNNQVTGGIDWSINGVINGAYDELTVEVYWDNNGSNQVGVCYYNALGEYYCPVIQVLVSTEAISLTSSSLNYIKTVTPREPVTNISGLNDSQKIETITYYDGLGKLRQKVDKQAGGNLEDIITPVVYDDFGRQTKDYLLYARISGNPSLDYEPQTDDFFDELNNQYQQKFPDDFTSTTPNPYSEKVLEASQLNRVLEQGAPGSDWQVSTPYHYGHNIKFDYQTNTTEEIRRFIVVHPTNQKSKTALILKGYYESNELYKTITKDENWVGGINPLLIDEKYHTTEEFKNKQGQVVLKRTYADVDLNNDGDTDDTGESEVSHDTHYIYDIFGNLTYVLPPKFNIENAAAEGVAAAIADGDDGVSDDYVEIPESELSALCYQYKYDHRNRLVEKKIPGKDPEYIVYNKLDQPILTQDAIQKTTGDWLFTKYDAFGRIAYTGKATSTIGTTREAIQTEVDSFVGDLWVTQSATSSNYGGVNMFYNNGAYPTSGALVTLSEILTINYYDTYVDRPISAPTSVVLMESSPSKTNITNVKGLATVSKVKVLDVTGPNVWITTLTYYDTKSRPIYVYSENTYLGTVDIVETKLDFVGKPTKSKTTHTKNGITIATIENYTYDHAGRLLTHTQCIGDQTMGYICPGGSATEVDLILTGDIITDQVASNSIQMTSGSILPNTRLWISPEIQEVIVDNTYDELGQLENKGVGGNILNTNRLQTVDYAYNIRGWLKQINDPSNLGNDLFSFKLNYNTTEIGSANTELYNGNISETIWKTANDESTNSTRAYAYSYDALNRITNADYGIKTSSSFNLSSGFDVGIEGYDKNGNILSLWRDNITDNNRIDQLTYAYDNNELSNRLKAVNDSSGSTEGFSNGASTTDEYTYDINGNMTQDDNKGITNIIYNHLNLPTQVTLASGSISYIYDATGVKLEKKIEETDKTDAYTYYAGNYIYQGSSLKFFNHPEGYVEPKNENDVSQGFNYIYQYKDHLGNVRLSYMDADEDGSITAATEILEENNYYPFGGKHKGYNNNPVTNHTYKLFQGQERTEDLGLNVDEWKYRISDPAIGRFWQIDPLAEDYVYNGTYNFSENRVIDSAELEGLERIYAADGKFINQVGDNKEIRVMKHNDGNAQGLISTANNTELSSKERAQAVSTLNDNSFQTFSSDDAAAEHFANYANPASVRSDTEFGAQINQVSLTEGGEDVGTVSIVSPLTEGGKEGTTRFVDVSELESPTVKGFKGEKDIAVKMPGVKTGFVHTHGNGNPKLSGFGMGFGGGDKGVSKSQGVTVYMSNNRGQLWKYKYNKSGPHTEEVINSSISK